jgi:uncharacterized protein (TIRG00374 family)
MGWFYGLITPGKIGSLIKIQHLKEKTGKSITECSSSVVLDKIFDLIVVFLLGFLSSLLLARYVPNLYLFAIAILCFLIISLVFIMKQKTNRYLLKNIWYYFIPEKYKGKIKSMYHEFYNRIPSFKKSGLFIIVTIAYWISAYSVCFLIAYAMGIRIPYYYFITLYAITTIISLIPISVNGLGTREATLIYLFSIFLIPLDKTMSYSIVVILLTMYIPAMIGLAEAFIFSKGRIKIS